MGHFFYDLSKRGFVAQLKTGLDGLVDESKVWGMNDIIEQQIQVDPTGVSLVTRRADGSVSSEPITAEEAAQWQAEHGF